MARKQKTIQELNNRQRLKEPYRFPIHHEPDGTPSPRKVKRGERYVDSRGQEKVADRDQIWRWSFSYWVENPDTGERKHKDKYGHAETKAQAQVDGEAELALIKRGQGVISSTQCFGDWLHTWVDDREKRNEIQSTSAARHRSIIEHQIAPKNADGSYRPLPFLGALAPADIEHKHLTRLGKRWTEEGSACRGTYCRGQQTGWSGCPWCEGSGRVKLSRETAKRCMGLLGSALIDAEEDGQIPKPVFYRLLDAKKEKPKLIPKQAAVLQEEEKAPKFWTAEQAGLFIGEIANDRLQAFYNLTVFAGLRVGEAAGLKWADVDTVNGVITVRRTAVVVPVKDLQTGKVKRKLDYHPPKNGEVMALQVSEGLLSSLAAWRQVQEADYVVLREQLGAKLPLVPQWVLTNDAGLPFEPPALSRRWERKVRALSKTLGIPAITHHGARHTSASIGSSAGAPIEDIGAALRHKKGSKVTHGYVHSLLEGKPAPNPADALIRQHVPGSPLRLVAG